MQLYYVWYDNLLEELFCIEKSDMDQNYQKFKEQVEEEKSVLLVIEADSRTQAFDKYKKELDTLYNKTSMQDDSQYQIENIFEGEKEVLNEYSVIRDYPEDEFVSPVKRRVLH